jgi:hypothetical protein
LLFSAEFLLLFSFHLFAFRLLLLPDPHP